MVGGFVHHKLEYVESSRVKAALGHESAISITISPPHAISALRQRQLPRMMTSAPGRSSDG